MSGTNFFFFSSRDSTLIQSINADLICLHQQIGTSDCHTFQAVGNLFYFDIDKVAVKAEKVSLDV